MIYPNPWYILPMSADEFLLGMLELGTPVEVSLVGVFEGKNAHGVRGSRRDIDLPMHRDGEYSAALAAAQGGTYVERPNIDVVGLYCLREGGTCVTLIGAEGEEVREVYLRTGQALVFDNQKVLHGRRGNVDDRMLIRIWLTRHPQAATERRAP